MTKQEKNLSKNNLVVYQAANGAIEVNLNCQQETLFLTQQQVGQLFGVQKAAISKHVKNIFDSQELSEKSTVSILETVQSEGSRKVSRKMEYYNLDLILSIGYRVNSKSATKFRQWATKILREHITKGYTINPLKIESNYQEFLLTVDRIKELLPANIKVDTGSILELVKTFADTWLSLDAYDKENYRSDKATKKKVSLTADDLMAAILELKKSLIKKGKVTDIFASERNRNSIEGVIGNVMQSFGGKDVYPSLEEKAAHLLYFMVKNHPFVDGNKRSGAFAFVWFLQRSRILNTSKINPTALTALTLLIAESNPKEKDKMTGLVTMLLRRK